MAVKKKERKEGGRGAAAWYNERRKRNGRWDLRWLLLLAAAPEASPSGMSRREEWRWCELGG